MTRWIAYAVAMVLVMNWACGDYDTILALAFRLMGFRVPAFYAAAGAILVAIGAVDGLGRLLGRIRRYRS